MGFVVLSAANAGEEQLTANAIITPTIPACIEEDSFEGEGYATIFYRSQHARNAGPR
jgi:hypothetical protein